MKGGRLRGQGTYGCVFQPGLLCRGSKNPLDPNKVGKITSFEDARNEIKIGKYLDDIPNYKDYVICAEPTSCTPRAKSKQVDPDIDKCHFSEKLHLETTIQLTMPWGGYPLSRINLDPSRFNFLKFMEELLGIGTFLIVNDVCHFDIWGQNLLFDTNNKPRLIDFGFAFRPSMLKPSDLSLRWRKIDFEYDTESPEESLMVWSHQHLSVEDAIMQLKTKKPAVQALASICGVSTEEWGEELRKWTTNSQSFQNRNWINCWKTYWPGFDAWSIGAVLLHILEIQLRFQSFNTSDTWITKGALIKNILKGLCRSHPAYRLDAAEALYALTNGKHPLISANAAGAADATNVSVASDDTESSAGYKWIQEKKQLRHSL